MSRLREAAAAVLLNRDINGCPFPQMMEALRQALEEDDWEAKCARFTEQFIERIGQEEWWWHDEWSTDVMPLAVECGIAECVPYDPAVHGENVEAEPGDDIYVWSAPPNASEGEKADMSIQSTFPSDVSIIGEEIDMMNLGDR